MIDKYYKVLDNGFVGLVDYMGSDEAIERSARTSYGKGTRKTSDTTKLIRYLKRHRHTSPMEFCEVVFHIQMPIYCARQFFRHRTFSFNEYSGRYSEMLDICERTDKDSWRLQSQSNKQGSEGELEDSKVGEILSIDEDRLLEDNRREYERRLELGVAREQARKDLPLSNYTKFYAKVDLHNLMHFLSLRCDSHAQKEIREYANVMACFVKELFPISFNAWYDYSFYAVNFTLLDRLVLNKKMIGVTGDSLRDYAESVGMSNREFQEFEDKIRVPELKNFTLDDYEELNIDSLD